MFLTLLFVVGLVVGVASGECARPTRTDDVLGLISSGRYAWLIQDFRSFSDLSDQIGRDVPCLVDVLPRSLAAQVHLEEAMRRSLMGDESGTVGAFQALLAVEPTFLLPNELAPAGHPLRDAFDRAREPVPATSRSLPDVEGARWRVDGEPALAVPAARPYLLQLVSDDGSIRWTGYLRPSDPLPIDSPDGDQVITAPRPRIHFGPPLLGIATVAGVAGGSLYTMAVYKKHDLGYLCGEELEAGRREVNGLVVGSGILGGTTILISTIAVVVW